MSKPKKPKAAVIEGKMLKLCKLQAQADELKQELGVFLEEGEAFYCSLGRLLKAHGARYTYWNREARGEIEDLKEDLTERGCGEIRHNNPSLRITVFKQGKQQPRGN